MAAPEDYFQRIDLTDAAGGGDTVLDRTGDNVREDFLNAIYNIAPTDTPFMSGIGRGTSKDIYTSWQQDTLEEPDDGNAVKDGADIGTGVGTKARRVGNINQISTKNLTVSGRAEVVDKAGRSSEMAYQLAKKSKSLKRDMEAILTGNQGALPDLDGDTASLLGGLRACFRDAVAPEADTALTAVDGANGGVGAAGYPTVATPGTVRALTQTLLDTGFQACYTNGGNPNTIMVSPKMKSVISAYLYSSSARVAALYSDIGQKTSGVSAQSSVDVYIHDFGMAKIVPNRFLGYTQAAGAPADDVYLLDMGMWSTLYLRSFRTKTIPSQGDSERRLLLVDYTLQYNEEMASGVIADIDSTAAMTA
jgi:hypothetical protein